MAAKREHCTECQQWYSINTNARNSLHCKVYWPDAYYKGVAAVVCEAMEAARHHDLEDYMRQQISTIIEGDEWVDRFVEGSRIHAVRRRHEMQAVAAMLAEDGLSSSVTDGTIKNLSRYC